MTGLRTSKRIGNQAMEPKKCASFKVDTLELLFFDDMINVIYKFCNLAPQIKLTATDDIESNPVKDANSANSTALLALPRCRVSNRITGATIDLVGLKEGRLRFSQVASIESFLEEGDIVQVDPRFL